MTQYIDTPAVEFCLCQRKVNIIMTDMALVGNNTELIQVQMHTCLVNYFSLDFP